MSSDKISIVIPTLNESKYIDPLLESLQSQTVTADEIIAIDASTDDTPRKCEAMGIKIVKQKKPGISAAREEGFAATSGTIIMSTDADSKLSPDWVKSARKSFVDPGVVCVYGPTHFYPGFTLLNFLGDIFQKITRLLNKDHVYGMNFAVRRSAFEKIGGYNLTLHTAEDVDLGYRIRKIGKIVFNPNMKVLTSPRRFKDAPLPFFMHHFKNYISITFFNRASSNFKPIR